MGKPQSTTPTPKASRTWEHLEDFVREHVQQFIQALLEEEVTELLGRTKSARREAVDVAPGYRNGYGKPRRLPLRFQQRQAKAAVGKIYSWQPQRILLSHGRCFDEDADEVIRRIFGAPPH